MTARESCGYSTQVRTCPGVALRVRAGSADGGGGYAESVDCIRTSKPPTWEPGGDIYVMTMRSADNGRGKWSEPRLLLKQSTGGYPKVIANKLVVLSTGEWCETLTHTHTLTLILPP